MIELIKDVLPRIASADAGKPRKKIAVLGAGMAGLTAAFELNKLGHEVIIYEYNERIGGRAWTHRFKDGQYHELGAMRFHKEHDFTRYYAGICGLQFRKFVNHHDEDDSFYFIKGVLSKHIEWDVKLLPELKLSESDEWMIGNKPIPPSFKGKQLLNLVAYPLGVALDRIMDNPTEIQAILGLREPTPLLRELDNISLGAYLRQFIQSQDALDLIGAVTGLEVWWDRAVTMFLREDVLTRLRQKAQCEEDGLDEIIGGTDTLPAKLHEIIVQNGVKVFTKQEVFSLNRQREHIQVGIKDEKGVSRLEDHDHVICTIPFSVLRGIKLVGLSSGKMNAIRNLSYGSSTKVLLNTKERFWETKYNIIGGGSQTDLINRQIYYPSDNATVTSATTAESPLKAAVAQFSVVEKHAENKAASQGPGVLVGSYCWEQDARRLAAMGREGATQAVINAVANIHPEILENGMIKDAATIFWDTYRYSNGAFCFMKPGDFVNYYADAIKPEGNLHFAGEHCSLDNGWIQGAIISSLKVVESIVSK
jgi:monoamine oxidase